MIKISFNVAPRPPVNAAPLINSCPTPGQRPAKAPTFDYVIEAETIPRLCKKVNKSNYIINSCVRANRRGLASLLAPFFVCPYATKLANASETAPDGSYAKFGAMTRQGLRQALPRLANLWLAASARSISHTDRTELRTRFPWRSRTAYRATLFGKASGLAGHQALAGAARNHLVISDLAENSAPHVFTA
jgi:hypothetical protein